MAEMTRKTTKISWPKPEDHPEFHTCVVTNIDTPPEANTDRNLKWMHEYEWIHVWSEGYSTIACGFCHDDGYYRDATIQSALWGIDSLRKTAEADHMLPGICVK